MLTGQIVRTEGDIYAGNEVVVEKRKEGKFPPPKPIALDSISNAFDFEDKFESFKYAPR